jgi:PilZ domain
MRLGGGWDGGMRTTHSKDLRFVPMTEERRQCARYKIDCPVTVLTPGRGKKRLIGRGWLYDINDKGARFLLECSLDAGSLISIEVDFLNPDGQFTTIRFRGIVTRVSPGDSYEIAVSFLKGESYVRGKGSRVKKGDSPWNQVPSGSHWIN